MKPLIVVVLMILSLLVNSQETTILELSEDEISWIKNKVMELDKSSIQERQHSNLQGLVDLVYIETNNPKEVMGHLSKMSSIGELGEKYPEYKIYRNQIAAFKVYNDTLNREAVKLMVESTDLLFMPDYSFVGEEINVLRKGRFWLFKTLQSYEDNYSNKILGVYVREEPKRRLFPTILDGHINYYRRLTQDVPDRQERKYTLDPLSVNLDTLTIEEKEETLNDALNTRVVSFCGQDNTSMNQEILIYKLSAELKNWGVFIRSLLNVVSDNVSRASDDPRSSAMREKYYYNMRTLGIDPWSLLLGGYIDYEGKRDNGIFVARQLIPALIFDLEIEKYFNEVLGYVYNHELDYVNRYRMIRLAATFTQYSQEQEQHDRLVEKLYESISAFPTDIQRIICQRIFGRESSRC